MSKTIAPAQLTFEQRVYNNYRAALKSLRKNVPAVWVEAGKNWRPAQSPELRQMAREYTVVRYGIPFAEVKRIIREQDAINGITHEKPVAPWVCEDDCCN